LLQKITPQDATARTKLSEYGNLPQAKHRLRMAIRFKTRAECIIDSSRVQAGVQYKCRETSAGTLPLSNAVYKMIIYDYELIPQLFGYTERSQKIPYCVKNVYQYPSALPPREMKCLRVNHARIGPAMHG